MPLKRPAELLLVEDSPSDIELITDILEESDTRHRLHVVRDGEAALEFLHRLGHHNNAPRPDLVMLDLNLPKKNGFEVLATVKADEKLRQIPVIVFTTSALKQDVIEAYDLHANAYMVKSDNVEDLIAKVNSVEEYWLSTVELPPAS